MRFLQVQQMQEQLQHSKIHPEIMSIAGGGNGLSSSSPGGVSAAPNQRSTAVFASQFCDSNLCFNGGRCDPRTQECKCTGHFMGEFLSVHLLPKTHTYKNNRLKIMDSACILSRIWWQKGNIFFSQRKLFVSLIKIMGF